MLRRERQDYSAMWWSVVSLENVIEGLVIKQQFAWPKKELTTIINRQNLAPQEGYHNLGLAGI